MIRQSIAQDVVRRMDRISVERLGEETKPVLDSFNKKIIHSGYSLEERVNTLEDGISKFQEKRKSRAKEDYIYRSASETLQAREDRAITGKVNWY